MSTATNQVVEGNMSPIGAAPDTARVQVTGQWLYDNFITSGEEQISRMNMVRILAKQATDNDLKDALKDAIEIAHKHDIKAGVPEKERGPKRQQAMNVRTIMQNAYGAIRRALPELEALGYNDKTGYQEMRVLAKKALDSKGIKWNGTKVPTQAEKHEAEQKAIKQARSDAMAAVMAENPRGDDESMLDYVTRIEEQANATLLVLKDEALDRQASKLATPIATKAERAVVERVVAKLQAFLDNTSTEMSDEEVDAVLHQYVNREEAEATVEEEATAE